MTTPDDDVAARYQRMMDSADIPPAVRAAARAVSALMRHVEQVETHPECQTLEVILNAAGFMVSFVAHQGGVPFDDAAARVINAARLQHLLLLASEALEKK